ncbi:hypothetical protein HKX48_005524 [Thoreauomyces humboldtii]|nr:hypothetical protein HKX48_005524 [Thoreauomyces humboldtii]
MRSTYLIFAASLISVALADAAVAIRAQALVPLSGAGISYHAPVLKDPNFAADEENLTNAWKNSHFKGKSAVSPLWLHMLGLIRNATYVNPATLVEAITAVIAALPAGTANDTVSIANVTSSLVTFRNDFNAVLASQSIAYKPVTATPSPDAAVTPVFEWLTAEPVISTSSATPTVSVAANMTETMPMETVTADTVVGEQPTLTPDAADASAAISHVLNPSTVAVALVCTCLVSVLVAVL